MNIEISMISLRGSETVSRAERCNAVVYALTARQVCATECATSDIDCLSDTQ